MPRWGLLLGRVRGQWRCRGCFCSDFLQGMPETGLGRVSRYNLVPTQQTIRTREVPGGSL